MRIVPALLLSLLTACSQIRTKNNGRHFTEPEILSQLDFAFKGIPTASYPLGQPQDIKYNFFIDLEHGYCETAGSRISVFGDSTRWAIVFEKSGYQNRGGNADIELDYVGNCINYSVDKYLERKYITNASRIELISANEYERIRNKQGSEMEQFETISPAATEVTVHGQKISLETNTIIHSAIKNETIRKGKSQKLLIYSTLVRILSDTNPALMQATNQEIRQHIPKDLPKIMVLNKFHFESIYNKSNPPSQQETYQLIAKVLATGNAKFWKPKQLPNNHWKNWNSGNL